MQRDDTFVVDVLTLNVITVVWFPRLNTYKKVLQILRIYLGGDSEMKLGLFNVQEFCIVHTVHVRLNFILYHNKET